MSGNSEVVGECRVRTAGVLGQRLRDGDERSRDSCSNRDGPSCYTIVV